ncbi:MAG: precorrin-6A/cobalt-precorrin-6A reductase, partial [Terrimicrobiaceae bacterium]
LNETLWRNWEIDCVVTKDSGEAGGFQSKADAAQAIGAALIVVERPGMSYPVVARDFQTLIRYLNKVLRESSRFEIFTGTNQNKIDKQAV